MLIADAQVEILDVEPAHLGGHAPQTQAVSNSTRSRSRSSGTSLRGRRRQITPSTFCTSATAVGRGSVFGVPVTTDPPGACGERAPAPPRSLTLARSWVVGEFLPAA